MRLAAIAGCCAVVSAPADLRAQQHMFGYAARVNDAIITHATLDRNFEEYLRDNDINIAAIRYPERVEAMRQETLDLLIEQELLWQAAVQQGVLASEQEIEDALGDMRSQFESEAAFLYRLTAEGYTEASYRDHLKRLASARKYRDSLISDITVMDADVHAYYTANPERFRIPESVRARHILVAVDPGAGEAGVAAARAEIESVLMELAAGADFAALASERSDDSSAARGGDLGYFVRGQMVETFEEAAFALQRGEISDVVWTPYGLHVIRLEDRQPPQLVDEALVREELRAFLLEQRRQAALEAEIAQLRATAAIDIS